MINPTIALTGPSGSYERLVLAERFHIHTVLSCHQPGNVNMSQGTGINESIVVMRRHTGGGGGNKPATRFINLDRLPVDDGEVEDLHECLARCGVGLIANGWGEVSQWPAERMAAGDWTPATWRSVELAEAAAHFATHPDLQKLEPSPDQSRVHATGQVLRGSFQPAAPDTPGSFPILKSKGADGQTRIQSQPDEFWIPKKRDEEAQQILQKAGYLLITAGQNNSTGRLTATGSDEKYIGNGWIPVTELSATEAKAVAVFVNSTAGRLQLMRNPGRTLVFPTYSVVEAENIRIPDIKDDRIRQVLADCWERTKDMEIPQFRDGECEVRRLWDEAVAEALCWDAAELARLRWLLHQEPHVRGLGYNQYADEPGDNNAAAPLDRETFEKPAEEWERDRPGSPTWSR